MNVESLNSLFQWASVGLIAITFFVGAGALWTGSIINKRQTERLVLLETALATQQERAASAELRLEEEREARRELARRTGNRWLSNDEISAISVALAKYAGQQVEIAVFPNTFETGGLALLIGAALSNAKWDVRTLLPTDTPPHMPYTMSGDVGPVRIMGNMVWSTPDDASVVAANALRDALSQTAAASSGNPSPLSGPPRIVLYVGEKGNPLSTSVKD
jgi:hypothetical protein